MVAYGLSVFQITRVCRKHRLGFDESVSPSCPHVDALSFKGCFNCEAMLLYIISTGAMQESMGSAGTVVEETVITDSSVTA